MARANNSILFFFFDQQEEYLWESQRFFFYIKKLLKKGAITRREVIDAHSAPGIFGPITFQYIFVYIFLNKYYSCIRYFTSDKDFVLIITILGSKWCADSKFLESDFTPAKNFFT